MSPTQAVSVAESSPQSLTIDDVRAAAERIRGAVVRTPTMYSKTLSDISGADIWLKFENLQFTAAYKERGALNALLLLSQEQRDRGVIAASAGNHSQGLSYHGTRLGVPVTIVMPRPTPTVKVMQTESVGGNVVLHGETFDEAYAHARKLEKELGLTFVHPFDDPHVAAGAGTTALEMLEDAPEIDCIVTPIGGGGLISGMSTVARALRPEMQVIGVQAALFPSMYAKVKGEQRDCGGDTLAEGIAVKAPGAFTSQVIAERVDDIVLVSEEALEKAVSLLLQIEKTVVEAPGPRVSPPCSNTASALPGARSDWCCAAATSTPACSPTSCFAILRVRGGWRGSGSRCRTGPARSIASCANSRCTTSTSSRSTISASSPAFRRRA